MELEILRRNAEARGSATLGALARVKALVHQEILDLRFGPSAGRSPTRSSTP